MPEFPFKDDTRIDSDPFSVRLHQAIPGGAHTYSRGDDQYPLNAPAILERGKGAYVWDPYGNRYLDYGMALRAVTLGYSHDEVDQAAFAEIKKGNNLTRASVTELLAAEKLIEICPSAERVKFAKNGSTVVSAATKLARAYTNRNMIARCAQHPFFSFDDWFIGSTVMNRGIPRQVSDMTVMFDYNDIESLQRLFLAYPGQISCVVLEPVTNQPPKDGFLQKVKDLCRSEGAVFVLDEMITGFRWDIGGAQTYFGIDPDLCTFGKAMANGFSVAALAGKKEIMDLGGIMRANAERMFLISTTHGAEMCGLGAFLKSVEVLKRDAVIEQIWSYGRKLIDGMNEVAKMRGVENEFYFEGYPCSPGYVTKNREGEVSLDLRTLFSQEMIRNGVMMPWVALSAAHGPLELELTLDAASKALSVYRDALDQGVSRFLVGRAIKPVFRQRN